MDRNPMKMRLQRTCGLTLVELLVVLVVVMVLAVLGLRKAEESRHRAQRISCIGNLKQIGLAFRIWAGDHDEQFPMAVSNQLGGSLEWVDGPQTFRHFQVASNELNTPVVLVCPADTDRRRATKFDPDVRSPGVPFNSNTNLSYFIGLDADDRYPARFLSGDRHITNGLATRNNVLNLTTSDPTGWTKSHNKWGNIGLADGSVQSATSPVLRDMIAVTGLSTNRLAMP